MQNTLATLKQNFESEFLGTDIGARGVCLEPKIWAPNDHMLSVEDDWL